MTLIIAHRGASAIAAENSRDAVGAAIAAGADGVEVDVRLSADGVPVCLHDPDLRRTHGRAEPVGALTAAELGALGVPRLDQVVADVAGRVLLLLDCKQAEPGYWDKVVAATRDAPRVVHGVRSLDSLARLMARHPGATALGLLPGLDLFAGFAAGGGRIARLWEEDLAPAALDLLAGLGLPVWVTAGPRDRGRAGEATRESVARIRGFGVAGILLNDPRLARPKLA